MAKISNSYGNSQNSERVFDIRDYDGIDLDGNNDSTTDMQAAIDEAGADRGRLFCPRGTVAISSPLNITAGRIDLFAKPASFELIQSTADTDHLRVGDGTSGVRSSSSSTSIKGINFICDPSETTPFVAGSCINLNWVFNIDIDDCTFYGWNSSNTTILYNAIYMNQYEQVRSDRCRVEHMKNSAYWSLGTNTTDKRGVDALITNPYIKDCEGISVHIDDYSEAFRMDNFAITQSGNTPVAVDSAVSNNGQLHVLSRPNIEASAGIVTGIDVLQGKQIEIQGGWVGKFTNSIRFRSASSKASVSGTRTNGRILVEGPQIDIDAVIEDSSPDGGDGLLFTGSADNCSMQGRVSDFSGDGISFSGSPTGINVGPVVFNTITGEPISGGGYSGGPVCNGLTKEDSGTSVAVSASSTLNLQPGNDFFVVSGATTIDNINIRYPNRRLFIQASGGPININNTTGNIRTSSTSYASGKVIELVCDSSTWFEVGSNV